MSPHTSSSLVAHHNRDTIAIHSGLVFQKKWVWNSRVLLPFTSATATSWKMDQWIRIWIRILVLDSASMKNILSEARNGKNKTRRWPAVSGTPAVHATAPYRSRPHERHPLSSTAHLQMHWQINRISDALSHAMTSMSRQWVGNESMPLFVSSSDHYSMGFRWFWLRKLDQDQAIWNNMKQG